MRGCCRVLFVGVCGLFLCCSWSGRASAGKPGHPFLFLTAADINRARQGIRQDKEFARLATELVARATIQPEQPLPTLQREWWAAAKAKAWSETYPEIFHHTFIVPMKWADLARTCARASLVSGAMKRAKAAAPYALAAKAKGLLLSLADYTYEFDHFDVGMNYTLWTIAALDAYDIVYDQLTPAERGRMDALFERYLAALVKNDEYWVKHEPGGTLNNHYAWHKLGLAMLGLFYGRAELVEQALSGPKGVQFMLEHGLKDDGLWLEGSIPYQFAATTPLLLLAEVLENAAEARGAGQTEAGVGKAHSLFRERIADGYSVKQSYDALIPLLFPDRTLPTIGDCYARRPHAGEHPDWEVLYRRFRDPPYAWLIGDRRPRTPQALFNGLPKLPLSPAPPQFSKLWPEMGYGALRTTEGARYWTGTGWSVFATYSARPVHDNADKLGIILFGNGHLWLPDCEARTSAEHPFSANIQKRLNRETLCHNTLLVDGRSQRFPGAPLDLVEFRVLPEVKRLTMGDLRAQLYQGIRQLRTIIATDRYVLDVFQVQANETHDFTWVTHIDGRSVAGSVSSWVTATLPAQSPWTFLREPSQSSTGQQVFEVFEHEGKTLRLDLLTDGPLTAVKCGFPRDDSPAPATVPMRLFGRKGATAHFVALYRLGAGSNEAAELRVQPGELGTLNVESGTGRQTQRHIIPRLDALW